MKWDNNGKIKSWVTFRGDQWTNGPDNPTNSISLKWISMKIRPASFDPSAASAEASNSLANAWFDRYIGPSEGDKIM